MQAAILSELLPLLDAWNERRRQIAQRYAAGIAHPDVVLPRSDGEDYVAHLYVVRSPRRDLLRKHLADAGIAGEVHYPVPDHRQPVFGDHLRDVVLPNTEALCGEVLTLPCYPEMSDDDAQRVIAAVNSWPR
jgi:dTDP-4-amino-4,6-dideoxygalactose transaminase